MIIFDALNVSSAQPVRIFDASFPRFSEKGIRFLVKDRDIYSLSVESFSVISAVKSSARDCEH